MPDGKLVCLDIEASGGKIKKIRITGDFFLHPEETITSIEHSLIGKGPDDDVPGIVSHVLAACDAQMIGATAVDLGRLVRKAIR